MAVCPIVKYGDARPWVRGGDNPVPRLPHAAPAAQPGTTPSHAGRVGRAAPEAAAPASRQSAGQGLATSRRQPWRGRSLRAAPGGTRGRWHGQGWVLGPGKELWAQARGAGRDWGHRQGSWAQAAGRHQPTWLLCPLPASMTAVRLCSVAILLGAALLLPAAGGTQVSTHPLPRITSGHRGDHA